MYFDQELCLFHLQAESQEEVLTKMAQMLLEKDIVTNDFLNGILQREKEYPTGLLVNAVGFALPHTDSSSVNKPQICFASLKNPINFCSMADKDDQIPVKFIFMLAMKQPHEQLENLQNLVTLFQDQQKVQLLAQCHSTSEFISILASAGVN